MTLKEIQNIIKDFEKSQLTILELETEDFKLRLSKNKTSELFEKEKSSNSTSNIKDKESITITQQNHNLIKSPLVGTFYASSTPKGKPYVEVGQKVTKGQVVCIIEAMKIMNEITSPYSGTVKEILVNDGDTVGFNHHLIQIDKDHEE
ncbi:MAG: acetyl-CoA carboxylase biotin carboxyl carrier protein [Acholeplasmataceae bacterium]